MKSLSISNKDKLFYSLFVALSLGLLAATAKGFIPSSFTEDLGFITGALCVWLVVKENIWNWPIGIANSIFFLVLFYNARLFADMSLQIVYIILGFLGWYWWLRGGKNNSELSISHASYKTLSILFVIVIVATAVMTIYLTKIHDSAPFWDALTTVGSLVAQYLLTKKFIENWYFWIGVDVIYVVLYAVRDLFLTSILYALFLTMCVIGLREWRRLEGGKHGRNAIS